MPLNHYGAPPLPGPEFQLPKVPKELYDLVQLTPSEGLRFHSTVFLRAVFADIILYMS